ncbi:hypothetical protein CSUI_009723 [Cystoisospora suis]|uniref:Transmembrane protein n=1 Tax=Cystoisospora suis TaxID=483139 RepID=A0A2C6JFP0_9APIC|nr:hypothetical protein CSUI_009723 [Cystoisospora suis]
MCDFGLGPRSHVWYQGYQAFLRRSIVHFLNEEGSERRTASFVPSCVPGYQIPVMCISHRVCCALKDLSPSPPCRMTVIHRRESRSPGLPLTVSCSFPRNPRPDDGKAQLLVLSSSRLPDGPARVPFSRWVALRPRTERKNGEPSPPWNGPSVISSRECRHQFGATKVLSGRDKPWLSPDRTHPPQVCVSEDQIREDASCGKRRRSGWFVFCPHEVFGRTRFFGCVSGTRGGDRTTDLQSVGSKNAKSEVTQCQSREQVGWSAGRDNTRGEKSGPGRRDEKEKAEIVGENGGGGEAANKRAEELADKARTAESMWQTFVPEKNWGLTSPVFWILLVLVIVLHQINEKRDRDRDRSVTAADEAEARLREEVEMKRARRTKEDQLKV